MKCVVVVWRSDRGEEGGDGGWVGRGGGGGGGSGEASDFIRVVVAPPGNPVAVPLSKKSKTTPCDRNLVKSWTW